MLNREWIEATLRHEETGRVPFNFMFSPPALRRAEAHYGTPLEDVLRMPIRMSGPGSVKPLYADPAKFGETVTDEFGVVWSTSEIDRGSPIGPCLPDASLAGYAFPDFAAEYRFAGLTDWCAEREADYRVMWVGDLWERATFMRGMESLLLDLALHPAFVEDLLDGITGHILATMDILLERYPFEAIAVSDDYGTQKALVMSPPMWRDLVRPRLARIYGRAKQQGLSVFHHTCGNVIEIVADLIDIGLDILHPIQPEAMDILELKREFGRDLTLCGGVPTQGLLVSGTPEQVRAEVRRLKGSLGEGGGYILEPGITIQADVPGDNLLALIEEAMRDDD